MQHHKNFARLLILLVVILAPFLVSAQANLPDPLPEAPSNSNYFYKNMGQIIDDTGLVRSDIKFYTEGGYSKNYFTDNMVSFVGTIKGELPIPDSSARIDLEFLCNKEDLGPNEPCGILKEYEDSHDFLNYYLPHCLSGITDVPGYARLVYEEAFPKIDVHFYSNSSGPKNYIVINPGGDPNDIVFKFSGQDSISLINNNADLALYLSSYYLVFPEATAYQIDTNNVATFLNWQPTWINQGGGIVALSMGVYDNAQPLVIRFGAPTKPTGQRNDNLWWATYYGSSSYESHIATDVENIYNVVFIAEHNYPIVNGVSLPYPGHSHFLITKFDEGQSRTYATYFGGNGEDQPYDIGVTEEFVDDEVIIVGSSRSTIFPSPSSSGYHQTTNFSGLYTGIITAFDKDDLHLTYSSLFGGNPNLELNTLALDLSSDRLYVAGNIVDDGIVPTNSTSPSGTGETPLYGGSGTRYYQTNYNYASEANNVIVTEFELSSKQLLWSTVFGGEGDDVVKEIIKVNKGGESSIYIVGHTTSLAADFILEGSLTNSDGVYFPLASPGGATYFQTYNTGGYMAKFDESYQLSWSSFYERLNSVAVNSQNDVYVVGTTSNATSDNSCSQNSFGYFPLCNSSTNSWMQTALGGLDNQIMGQFDNSGVLQWSTYFGGESKIWKPNKIVIDDEDNIYVAGSATNTFSPTLTPPSSDYVPVSQVQGYYWQPYDASYNETNTSISGESTKEDAYLSVFDNTNQLLWSTHYGGARGPLTFAGWFEDELTDICLLGHKYLIISGQARSPLTPTQEPTQTTGPVFMQTSNISTMDAFIAEFDIEKLATNVPTILSSITPGFIIYPNPSNGKFQIEFMSYKSDDFAIEVINQLGQVIKKEKVISQKGKNQYILNLGSSPAGIYMVKISNSENQFYEKIIKM